MLYLFGHNAGCIIFQSITDLYSVFPFIASFIYEWFLNGSLDSCGFKFNRFFMIICVCFFLFNYPRVFDIFYLNGEFI